MKYYVITVADNKNNCRTHIINQEPQKWFIEYMKEVIANLPYENSPNKHKHSILYSYEICKKDYQTLKKMFN